MTYHLKDYPSREAQWLAAMRDARRDCGHLFVLAATCPTCARWLEEVRA